MASEFLFPRVDRGRHERVRISRLYRDSLSDSLAQTAVPKDGREIVDVTVNDR